MVNVRVESNVDSLSAHTIHRLFVDLVRQIAETGEEILHTLVPRGKTHRLEQHVGHSGPRDEGERIVAEIGVSAIDDAFVQRFQTALKDMFSPGEQDAANYPVFVDRGTGIFGPVGSPIFARRARFMKFEAADGASIFRHSVQGQPGQHFMLHTYSILLTTIPALLEQFKVHLGTEMQARKI